RVVGGDVEHVLFTEIFDPRTHYGIDSGATLVVAQLLVDRRRILACKVGSVGVTQPAWTVTHGALKRKCRASSDGLGGRISQHVGCYDDGTGFIARDAYDGGCRPVADEARGAAYGIPGAAKG